jgi:hypothetical protein
MATGKGTWALTGLVTLANIVMYVIILLWAIRLHKNKTCRCARDGAWRVWYVVLFPPIAFLIGLLVTALSVSHRIDFRIHLVLLSALLVGWMLLISFAWTYVRNLRRNNCECATSGVMGDETLEMYASLRAGLIGTCALALAAAGGASWWAAGHHIRS